MTWYHRSQRAPWIVIGVGLLGCGPPTITLTGIVTTNDVLVSSQVAGQIDSLLVTEGDSVTRGQLLAVVAPGELRAENEFYTHSAQSSTAQVRQAEATLRWQNRQTTDRIAQAEATAAAVASQQRATEADLEMAQLTFQRIERLTAQGLETSQQLDQARTGLSTAKARLDAAAKQADAARAALELARGDAEQNVVRQTQLDGSRQSAAAAAAQRARAGVRLGYTELRSPAAGVIDVRVARQGEVVSVGQPIVTVVNPDDLWVRADVEESYIDRVRRGDKMTVRLPSGAEREGLVIYIGADAGFATQRDVSRTKRDIKTFEVRLKVDNQDRRLAVGMTAYVLMPAQ